MDAHAFEVPDDSGLLAIVDPDAYVSFVAEDWTFARLVAHFRAQMAKKRLLIWDTSRPDIWRVQISLAPVGIRGIREVSGPIVASQGRLLLTSFDSLSMAAQFDDVTLPEPHEQDRILAIPIGEYHCRIIQIHVPGVFVGDSKEESAADFVIELARTAGSLAPWADIPWLRRDQFEL